MLVTVMTRPVPRCRIEGKTACVTRQTPKKLISMICRRSCMEVFSMMAT